MKSISTTAALAASLIISSSIGYAGNKGEYSSDSKMSGNISMHRVSEDSVENQITAKDLIGAAVYDGAGEKIGTIADISTRSFFGQSDKDDSYGMNDSASKSSKSDSMMDSADKNWSRSAHRSDSSSTAFISVGGLWGIGDDIVAVPVDRLSYDKSKNRFTLAVSKAQVVALAEQETLDLDNLDKDDEYYSAKQSFNQDLSRIREALRTDKTLSADKNIMVTNENDKIVLSGTVSSKDAKEYAQKLAEAITDQDVKNSLEVRKSSK